MIDQQDAQLMTKQELEQEIKAIQAWLEQFDMMIVPAWLQEKITKSGTRLELLRGYLSEFEA